MFRKNFKLLSAFYRPYRGLFAADLICAMLVSGIALIVPLGVRYIADTLLNKGEYQLVLRAGLLLLGLVIVQALCTYFYDYQGHYLGAKIERDMRSKLFSHCQRLSFSYYDSHTVGDLMSRITNDTLSLAEFFHHVPEDLLINSVKLVGAAAILMSVHWQTTCIILAFLPFMLMYTLYFNRRMGRAMEGARQSMGQINAQAEDSLSGIRVVQSFCGEAMEEEKFSRLNSRFLEDRRVGYQSESRLYTGMDAFAAIIPIAVVVFGGLAILQGGMDVSDLLLFLLYIGYFTGPVKDLVNTSRLLQEGRTSFRRYRELMDTQPGVTEKPGAGAPESVRGDIEFRNVSFRYGEGDEVFQGLDLKVKAGEYVALVGASGVGKTTLCALLPRFYESGELSLIHI